MTSRKSLVTSARANRADSEWSLRGISTALFGVVLLMGPALAADPPKFVRVDRDFIANQPEMFVEDEFIVVLVRDVRANVGVGRDATGRPTVALPALQKAISRNNVNKFARQFPGAQAFPAHSKYPDLTGHYKVRIDPGTDLDAALTDFGRLPHVESVEKIGIHPIYADPNDPYYRDSPNPSFPFDQWHYFDRGSETYSIQADEAWEIEAGHPSVIIAVADSGVRYYHRDLGGDNTPWGPANPQINGNIFVNPDEIPGTGVDNDGNGFIDDTIGWDFVTTASCGFGCSGCCDTDCSGADNDPRDHNGHGTHLAGTIAAITNNDRLVAGVAGGFSDGTTSGAGNGVKILPLRIGYSCQCQGICGWGFVRMDFAAEAFNYVAMMKDRGFNIAAINCSWGSSNSGGLDAAVNAVLARDVMVIHAAGNSNSSSPDFLGTKAGVMSVAATTPNGSGASFTNHGSWVEVAAPGVDILSTYHHFPDPANDYIALQDGTSMAAPHVAGIVGLLTSCDPTLTRQQKFDLIVNNTRPYNDSRNLGSGIANAKLALQAAGCLSEPDCTTNADCNDGDPCTIDLCSNGVCSNTPIDCDDGSVCTTDSCVNGVCVNDPIICDDRDPCTTDSCDPVVGCVHTPIDCDDGSACTTDACVNGVCVNDPINCDDGNPCTTDSCDPAVGCVHTPIDCDDGDACTIDACVDGVCQHTPVDCDDGNPCTTDTCDPGSGCINTFLPCGPADGCCGPECTPQNDPDCETGPECGNGVCEPGEDCNSCPQDCFAGTGAVCGNGICETAAGENCQNCPADCNGVQNGPPSNRYCCGDGGGTNPVGCNDPRCTGSGNTCSNEPAVSSCCGDGVCEGAEDSFNCSVDCGDPPVCGDGTCDPGEDQCNCPEDCGTPPATETNCSDGIDNNCNGLIDCADPDCAGDPACSGPVCGNGICEGWGGENCQNCPADCNGVQNGPPSNRYCCGDGGGTNPVPCSDSRCTSGGNQCEN